MADEPKGPVVISNAGKIGTITIGNSQVIGVDLVHNVGEIGSIAIEKMIHAKSREDLLGLVVKELSTYADDLTSIERAQLQDVQADVAKAEPEGVKATIRWLGQLAQKVATEAALEGTKMLMRAYGLTP